MVYVVVKQRADWNPALEKSLVDILHEYKDSGYRGDNGWNSEGWNKMVKEFHLRNKYAIYTKSQIQDKEGQLWESFMMVGSLSIVVNSANQYIVSASHFSICLFLSCCSILSYDSLDLSSSL